MKLPVIAHLSILPSGRPRVRFDFGKTSEQPVLIKDFLYQLLRYSQTQESVQLPGSQSFPPSHDGVRQVHSETGCAAHITLEVDEKEDGSIFVAFIPTSQPIESSFIETESCCGDCTTKELP